MSRRAKLSARERGRLKRRLREIAQEREEKLSDLGGLALEMHKRDRFEPGLLSEKATVVATLDEEASLLRKTLDEGHSSSEVEAPGDASSKLGPAAGSQPQ
jgi:hypothetical protein